MNEKKSHSEAHAEKATPVKNGNALSWVAAAVLVLALAAMAGFYWHSKVKIQEVRFEGNYFVSTERLREVEVPLGMNPDSMNFIKIMNRFKEIPYVKQVEIKVKPGGSLAIDVTERRPVALLSDGGYKVYVDGDGIKLPVIPGKAVDVPVLYGFSAMPPEDTLDSAAFKKTAEFLVKVGRNPVSDATISEVAWTDQKGIVAMTNEGGVKLFFGKDHFDIRLRNWEAFYGKIIKQKGMETMRTVDLRFKGQIVSREI